MRNLNKKLLIIFGLLILGLFISGCAGPVGSNIQSKEELFVHNPKDIIMQTSVGQFIVKSAEGPNGEECNIDINSLRDIIEDNPPSGEIQVALKATTAPFGPSQGGGTVTICTTACSSPNNARCCLVNIGNQD